MTFAKRMSICVRRLSAYSRFGPPEFAFVVVGVAKSTMLTVVVPVGAAPAGR